MHDRVIYKFLLNTHFSVHEVLAASILWMLWHEMPCNINFTLHFNPNRNNCRICLYFIHFRHVGDLGNVEEDGEGKVSKSFTDSVISLHGDQSIIGRSVVVSLILQSN